MRGPCTQRSVERSPREKMLRDMSEVIHNSRGEYSLAHCRVGVSFPYREY